MKTATSIISVTLISSVLLSPMAGAGEPGWVVAGKILAGAAVAGAVAHHVVHGPPPAPANHLLPPPPPDGRPPMPPPVPPALLPLVQTTMEIERMGQVIYRTDKSCRNNTAPIVIQLGDGRRIYQPAVHGHPAYIQVWSAVHHEWISIKEHPSVW